LAAERKTFRNSKSRNNRFFIVLLFFLVVPCGVYPQVPDNGSWLRSVIRNAIEFPDSLLRIAPSFTISILNESTLSPLVREAIVEGLGEQNCLGAGTLLETNAGVARLEVTINSIGISCSELYRENFFKQKKFRRIAQFDIILRVYDTATGRFIWGDTAARSVTEELFFKDLPASRSLLYPGLDLFPEDRPFSNVLNGIIILGTLGAMIYFLYK
jgi:hypothetical protein